MEGWKYLLQLSHMFDFKGTKDRELRYRFPTSDVVQYLPSVGFKKENRVY